MTDAAKAVREAARERHLLFRERKEAEGLKRISLWVRPEDVAALQEAARQPRALARLRNEVRAGLAAEIAEATEQEGEGRE